MTFHLTGGGRHDSTVLPVLIDTGAVRCKRGSPRLRARRVAGDKAFVGQLSRTHLRSRGIGAVIPTNTNQPRRHGGSLFIMSEGKSW